MKLHSAGVGDCTGLVSLMFKSRHPLEFAGQLGPLY
jgi:hypothetical protein